MTDEAYIYDLVTDFKRLAENFLYIIDKRGSLVPLKLNKAQEIVYNKYLELKKQGKPIRILLLKARQMGMSTLSEGLIYQRNSFEENRKAGIVAHVSEASTNLFNMFKTYHKYLPAELSPQLDKSNEKKMSYGKLNSFIKISTAESGDSVGRSDTYQDLHLSEVAFWRDANVTMAALLQTVPEEPGTMVIVESTANGIGGWFYDTWKAAEKGENEFTPIFLAWHNMPDYKRGFESEAMKTEFVQSITKHEEMLYNNFDLTLEQLHWYRHTLLNKLKGDMELMKQEYPSSAEEAFITSGRPVFNNDKCYENMLKCVDGVQGNIDAKGYFIENVDGYVTIHKDVEIGDREYGLFAAGVDVAEGLEQGDFSEVKVLDQRTDEVILTWHGHIDPDLFAYQLLYIQRYLKGKVFFEIEKNNHGLATIIKAHELGVNIKYSEKYEKGYMSKSHMGLGFTTNLKTKPLIIDQLNEWIRNDLFVDYDEDFWKQCLTFVRDEKGRMSAQNKMINPGTKVYDDKVIAEALMINCSMWLPAPYEEPLPEGVRLRQYLPEYQDQPSSTTF